MNLPGGKTNNFKAILSKLYFRLAITILNFSSSGSFDKFFSLSILLYLVSGLGVI